MINLYNFNPGNDNIFVCLFNFNRGICEVATFTIDKNLQENHRWAVN
jgi:hypothetical protein